MKLGVVNVSTVFPELNANEMWNIVNAIRTQIAEDYVAMWQSADMLVDLYATLETVPAETTPLVILDNADQAGILGYHSVTPDGRPYGRVFAAPIAANGGMVHDTANSLSCTLSHEVIETLGDPYANWWVDVDDFEEALELCDRVEGDCYSIGGIAVSNFLGPRAFSRGPGPYDHLQRLSSPDAIRPGGYRIKREGGPTGRTAAVWGDEYPAWRKDLKSAAMSRFQRRMPGPG